MNSQETKELLQKHYFDSSGLMTTKPDAGDDSTGNGLMHLGLWICWLRSVEFDLITHYDAEQFRDAVNRVRKDGLLYRSIWKMKPTSDPTVQDDYIGVMAGAYFTHSFEITAAILAHGSLSGWWFDPEKVKDLKNNLKFWHDRFPGLVSYYKMCGRVQISFWEKIAITLMILVNCFSTVGQADGRIQTYMKQMVFEDSYPGWSLVCGLWRFVVRKRFGTIGNSFKRYLRWGHPLTGIK